MSRKKGVDVKMYMHLWERVAATPCPVDDLLLWLFSLFLFFGFL